MINYESMSDNAIDVEVDKCLSAVDDSSRPAFRCGEVEHWVLLLGLQKIALVKVAEGVIVYGGTYSDKFIVKSTLDGAGRAVAICYLKIMERKQKSPNN